MTAQILQKFHPVVARWFADVFAAPTAVQAAAWESISAGHNALVVAPTGSGKTLSAFLWALNTLVSREEHAPKPDEQPLPLRGVEAPGRVEVSEDGVRVLYISPLKALGVDVQNNLRAPLKGIETAAAREGVRLHGVSVGVRSGDTPQAERARQVRNAPDVLITTPESLYLMLTSKAASILSDVDTVIIDEIHALAGTKRGSHLALSLERLERITEHEVQRIGLSATVRPIETVARFLGGDRDVDIVAPQASKQWDLSVRVPVPDMSDLPVPERGSSIGEATIDDPLGITSPLVDDPSPHTAAAEDSTDTPELPSFDDAAIESALPQQASIWPFIEQQLYEQVMAARSTLVFVNSRRSAERLTSRINELYAAEHQPEALSAARRRDPAQLMKSTDIAGEAEAIIARAHHGSVSKDERAHTEAALKSGELRCVVATSSLELGIDMGAVDLVIQVESPPSVASGLQRVGRAGHRVGAVSRATFYPKHRSDLVDSAVVVEKMRAGFIEALSVPTNPLDVLVQQTIAATVSGDIHVDDWFDTVRRAYPYRSLDRSVFDSVIDLASGVYPSTDFAELKPRVNFDRVSGMLSARPGAQRVAVTSGGTIPDRGMFGVFLAGGGESGPRRVGELDEEMVYESRVGDVFTLGASSWRIEEITRDQVLVTPAPGHTGRLPFWGGDSPGRPAELGVMIGEFLRRVADDPQVLENTDLDQWAKDNLTAFIREQQQATGMVPDERTLLVERFSDELGDWRVVLHSPYGRGVNAAWALAVGARIAEQSGIDAQAVAGDNGIVLRLPAMDTEPGPELFSFDKDEISDLVAEQVGNSALFASRFRECAARGLLLPRRNPGKRAPLWQQRQRAAQLLDVARKYPSFPIILETVRECLQDVYDLEALTALMGDIEQHRVRIAEITVEQPSPFASSLMFNYTGAFMYEGDTPLAEKRAAALSLDPDLLAKLLGKVELRELLDQDIIAEVHAQLQHTADRWRARTPEALIDILREIGPIPLAQLDRHADFPAAWEQLASAQQVMEVRIQGTPHAALATDAALLRDGLGVPVPPGVGADPATIDDAVDQLVRRFARSRGPFTAAELASAFGIGISVAATAASRNGAVEGHYRVGVEEQEYVDRGVLKKLRTRTLAKVHSQIEPVSQRAYAAFLPEWHSIAETGGYPKLRGADGVFAVCEQLAGVFLPASAWESLAFPLRVSRYSPTDLDELTQNGEVLVLCRGLAGARDPWVSLIPADYAAQLIEEPAEHTLSTTETALLTALDSGGAFLFTELLSYLADYTDELGVELPAAERTPEVVRDSLWSLMEKSLVSPEGFAPLRARLAGTASKGSTAHRATRRPNRSRLRMGRTSFAHSVNSQRAGASTQPTDVPGRFIRAIEPADPATEATARAVAHGEAWLDRYGVVTRGSIQSEEVLGGFALAYKVLRSFEETGKATRGYIIDGLGGAQFSTSAVVDRVRATREDALYLMAAADPANPYGAALDWPGTGFSRTAGAMVVLRGGQLLGHLSRGGKTLRIPEDIEDVEAALSDIDAALLHATQLTSVKPVVVEKINGASVWDSPLLPAVRAAGLTITPKGVRIGFSRGSAEESKRRGRDLADAVEAVERNAFRRPSSPSSPSRRGPFGAGGPRR
ncbi:DEAD/DEAH box helicase [Corynebacterium ciconiae]|uniref:DEAD/DEAH box helicase n=1 Tax=Corynebacterium ciconiae TaxID=227319 RepID=UPI000363ADA6|nr:DEAD/DEAH box helicase [Corynebacterium ciconiae]